MRIDQSAYLREPQHALQMMHAGHRVVIVNHEDEIVMVFGSAPMSKLGNR